jgi:hypothetical protein
MQLISHDDGGGFVHCVLCGGDAAGPCARCRRPVCGDCCVLTEGNANRWAICLSCDRKGGRDVRSGWWLVGMWLALPLVALCALLLILWWLFG